MLALAASLHPGVSALVVVLGGRGRGLACVQDSAPLITDHPVLPRLPVVPRPSGASAPLFVTVHLGIDRFSRPNLKYGDN